MLNTHMPQSSPDKNSPLNRAIPQKLLSCDVSRSRISPFLKRLIDLTVSLSTLVIFLPLLAALIVVVSLDGGPAFYVQSRVGRGGRIFRCRKFRTMVLNADEKLRNLLAIDEEARREYTTFWKLKDDPRITRVGRFLRRFSLDELPQILNVITGEMSIVGPRPRSIKEMEFFESHMREASQSYLMVRPGLTGLWQVGGRNELSLETKGWLDAHYAGNWSIRGDIVIIAATIPVVISGEGAF